MSGNSSPSVSDSTVEPDDSSTSSKLSLSQESDHYYKLSQLEQELEDIDDKEDRQLNLASFRWDNNEYRTEVLQKIDAALSDYGIAEHHHLNKIC
ncbi:hypothetical protein MKX08_009084 [Trichoderma sp. CBMAI-0020]|nr:hypothetical protein MKX08_009084 [Trichoderma sp. CBMAI-0020]